MRKLKAQTAPEYLILIASIVLLAALVYFFLSQAVFKPNAKEANESAKVIKGWINTANTSTVINSITIPLIVTTQAIYTKGHKEI